MEVDGTRRPKIRWKHSRVNYPVPVHHASTRPLGTKKIPVLNLEILETSMMAEKTGQNNDREKLEFFENIQPIKYCLRAWFQVIFC